MIVKAKIRSDIADGIYKTPILDDCYNGATLFLLKPGNEIEYDDEAPLIEHHYIIYKRDEYNVRHKVEHAKPMVKVKYFDITGLVEPYVIDGFSQENK